MPGQATITINGQVWTVSVATTTAELLAGLSGVASIPANTGILFDLGAEQLSIVINMTEMLFSVDILFISEELVVIGKSSPVPPGYNVLFSGDVGFRFFMEVNAGEMANVEIGDSVGLAGYTPSMPLDMSSIVELMVTMMIVVMMMQMMQKTIGEGL